MRASIPIVLFCLLTAVAADAAEPPNYICTGTVDGVATLPDGTVGIESFKVQTQVIGNGGPTSVNVTVPWSFLCNVNHDTVIPYTSPNSTPRTVTVEVCKAWLTTLLLAQATERSIALWLSTADTYGSCTALATNTSSSFKIRETTFGPALRN